MRKSLLVLLCMLDLTAGSYAQSYYEKLYTGYALDFVGKGAKSVPDLGYLICGGQNGDYYVLKADSLGNTEWTFTFDSIGAQERVRQVRQLTTGEYVVMGGGDYYFGLELCYIVRLSNSGVLLSHEVDTVHNDDGFSIQGISLEETPGGGYNYINFEQGPTIEDFLYLNDSAYLYLMYSGNDILSTNSSGLTYYMSSNPNLPGQTGRIQSSAGFDMYVDVVYGSDNILATNDNGFMYSEPAFFYVQSDSSATHKYDNFGALQWTKYYQLNGFTRTADIKQKTNDNYVFLFNVSTGTQSKIVLAETTPTGDTIWTHEFFGYGSAIANHLDLYPDESILISGESNGDAYIIKTDSSGYAPRIGIAGINQFYCQGDTAELSVHGGVSYLWSNGATDSTIQLTTSQSVWAMITDSSGHSFHSDNYHLVFHAPAIDLGPDTTICINDTLQLSAGSNYLAWQWQDMSTLNSYNAFSSVPDTQLIYVQVTDSNSCIGSDSITVVFDVCNGIAQANESSFVSVFPNPAADKFSILNSSTERIRFSIYSIEGKIVYENQVEAGKTIVLETKNFPSGIYLIRTLTEDGMISVQKLLIGD